MVFPGVFFGSVVDGQGAVYTYLMSLLAYYQTFRVKRAG